MLYKDLTLDQKISLNGFFFTDETLYSYKIAMEFFGFKNAIDYFLTGNINVLYRAVDNFETILDRL